MAKQVAAMAVLLALCKRGMSLSVQKPQADLPGDWTLSEIPRADVPGAGTPPVGAVPPSGDYAPASPIDVLRHGNTADRTAIMAACANVGTALFTAELEEATPMWSALEAAAAANIADLEVSVFCISPFAAVVANEKLAPLAETGHAIETMALVLAKHPEDRDLQGKVLETLGATLLHATPEALNKWRAAGGIKIFSDALARFEKDPEVSNKIFGGLQYLTHNPASVRDIVNIGEPGLGLEMLMKRLHETPDNEAVTGDGTSLKCQLLATLDGIFMNDEDNSWSGVALEKGFMKELVHTMLYEGKSRQTQHLGCANMMWLASHNTSQANHVQIINAGGIQVMANAFANFNWVDDTPFMDSTVSQTFNVQVSCAESLKLLLFGGNDAANLMAKAGLVKTLIMVPQQLKTSNVQELLGMICWSGACVATDNRNTQVIGHTGAAAR